MAIKVHWLATLLIRPTGAFWNPNLQPTKYVYVSFVWSNRRTNILYFIRTPVTSHWSLLLTNQTQFPSRRSHLKQALSIYRQIFNRRKNIFYSIQMPVPCHWPLWLTDWNQTQFPSQWCHLKQTLLIYCQIFMARWWALGSSLLVIIRTLTWASMSLNN